MQTVAIHELSLHVPQNSAISCLCTAPHVFGCHDWQQSPHLAAAAGYMMPEYGPQQDEDDYEYGPQQDEDDYEEDPDFSEEDLALGGEPDEATLRRMLHGPPQQQDLALQYMRQRLNGGRCLSSPDHAQHVGSGPFEHQEVVLQCTQQRLDWRGCLPQQGTVCLHSNAPQTSTPGRAAAGPAFVLLHLQVSGGMPLACRDAHAALALGPPSAAATCSVCGSIWPQPLLGGLCIGKCCSIFCGGGSTS